MVNTDKTIVMFIFYAKNRNFSWTQRSQQSFWNTSYPTRCQHTIISLFDSLVFFSIFKVTTANCKYVWSPSSKRRFQDFSLPVTNTAPLDLLFLLFFQCRIYIVKFGTHNPRPHSPSAGFKFFQLHAIFGKFGKTVCWRHPPGGSVPHLAEILDPPLPSSIFSRDTFQW